MQMPPILEAQLSKEAALYAAQRMKTASDKIAASPYAPSVTRIAQAKQASVFDLPTRAAMVAEFYMQKAAEEGSLTPQGENTLADAAKDDTVARLDQRNRPEGTYTRGARGETNLPTPGIIGREVDAPSMGGSSKQAGLQDILAKLRGVPGAISGHAADAYAGAKNVAGNIGERLGSNPMESLTNIRNTSTLLRDPQMGHAADLLRGNRMDAIKNLGTQGAAGVAGLGTIGAGAMGVRHLMNRGGAPGAPQEPAPEEIAKAAMYVQANEDMPAPDLMGAEGGAQPGGEAGPEQMGRVMTFLHALKNKLPGMRPSPEAQIGAAGLGEQGEPGMEVMAHILDRAKTAEEADGMLQHILQALTEQGVPPSPELVQAITEAMQDDGDGDEGGAGGPPPAPPPGPPQGGEEPPMDPKTASDVMDKIRAGGKHVADTARKAPGAVADAARAAGKHVADTARKAPGAVAGAARSAGTAMMNNKGRTALGVGGAALAIGGGIAAKNHFGKKKEDEGKEVTAEDFWNDVLGKAAENNGSLTPQGENTLADAAKDDTVAKLDQKNRPEGTYSTAQGQTTLQTASGEVGDEKKVAEEVAYWESLRKVAEEWGAKLPATMPHERKREAIQKIAAYAPSQRAAFVQSLHG